MNLNIYAEQIQQFAKYQDANTGSLVELMYLTLGLTGEAGEIANKVKKLYRDCDDATKRTSIQKEIGDVFWYLTMICNALNVQPESVLDDNYAKLADRMIRGVISGSGDSR